MKNGKEEIDQLIEQALSKEEAAFYHQLDEQNIVDQFGGLFQGKKKWINVLGFTFQLIITGVAFYCGYRAFYGTDTSEIFLFGLGAILAMIAVGFLKIYYFMEMNKNAVIRELKRLEFQVSVLARNQKD